MHIYPIKIPQPLPSPLDRLGFMFLTSGFSTILHDCLIGDIKKKNFTYCYNWTHVLTNIMNRKISKLLNTKSLKINAVFNGLYQILVLLVPFITTPYISRIFGPGLRGDYAYYTSIVSYFTILATFGFNDFGTKIISQNRNNKEEKTKAFLGIRYIKFFLSLLSRDYSSVSEWSQSGFCLFIAYL